MKYITLLMILFFLSCKKEETKPLPPTGAMHNIKYEVKGFLNMEITYDGQTIHAGNTSNWDYTFTAPVGKNLSLSAYNSSGTQTIEVSIYQDGVRTGTANGYGTQSLTHIVK